jgi:hypothetical protein
VRLRPSIDPPIHRSSLGPLEREERPGDFTSGPSTVLVPLRSMRPILSLRRGTLDVGTYCCIYGTLIMPNFCHIHFVVRSVILPRYSLCPCPSIYFRCTGRRTGPSFGISTPHLRLSPRSLMPLVRPFTLRTYTLRICDLLVTTTAACDCARQQCAFTGSFYCCSRLLSVSFCFPSPFSFCMP